MQVENERQWNQVNGDTYDISSIKVMLNETIRNEDFWPNTAFNIVAKLHVSNSYNIVRALQRCVALKIVVANRPVYGVYTVNRTSHRL